MLQILLTSLLHRCLLNQEVFLLVVSPAEVEIGFFKAAIPKELVLKASVLMPTFGQESAKPLELSSSNGKKRKLMPATSRSETMGCTHYSEV